MQFRAFEPNIEVNGQTVFSIVDGFGAFKTLARKYLLEVGIGEVVNGEFVVDLERWYSQADWLKAFENIALKTGVLTLAKIGFAIPQNAIFPPWVVDIETSIQSIDVAYHLNHRKLGKVMFNMETLKMMEGIGHYGYEKIEGKNIIICECNNPYPCDFDRGIVSAMAQKFELNGNVKHDDSRPCRKNGADSCTYIVTW